MPNWKNLDENKWSKAKEATAKSKKKSVKDLHGDDFALVNYVYHKMGKSEEDMKMAEFYRNELLVKSNSDPAIYKTPESFTEEEKYSAIRQDVMAEYDAICLYEAHKHATEDKDLIKIFDHIIKEEKEHVELLEDFLKKNDQLGGKKDFNKSEEMKKSLSAPKSARLTNVKMTKKLPQVGDKPSVFFKKEEIENITQKGSEKLRGFLEKQRGKVQTTENK